MKAKGLSRRSLSLLKSALYNSIRELGEVCTAIGVDREVSITEFLGKLEWIILQFQALKDLVHQRKETIPKGKLHMCFKLPTLLRIWMIESELEVMQGPIVSLADNYMKLARMLQPELFPDKSRCLLQEQANNKTSPEMMSVAENYMKLARMLQPKLFPDTSLCGIKQFWYKRKLESIKKDMNRLDRDFGSADTDLKGLRFPETYNNATRNALQRCRQKLNQDYCLITSSWADMTYQHMVRRTTTFIQQMKKETNVTRLIADLKLLEDQKIEMAKFTALVHPPPPPPPAI